MKQRVELKECSEQIDKVTNKERERNYKNSFEPPESDETLQTRGMIKEQTKKMVEIGREVRDLRRQNEKFRMFK